MDFSMLAYLPDYCETWMEVGQSTRGQGRAACGELEEGLPLIRCHSTQHSHKAQETRTAIQLNHQHDTRSEKLPRYFIYFTLFRKLNTKPLIQRGLHVP